MNTCTIPKNNEIVIFEREKKMEWKNEKYFVCFPEIKKVFFSKLKFLVIYDKTTPNLTSNYKQNLDSTPFIIIQSMSHIYTLKLKKIVATSK